MDTCLQQRFSSEDRSSSGLVVVPASRLIATDESERTQMVGKMAKAFGKTVTPTLVVLVLTGIYNALWYAPPSQTF